jgi:hypothetical protein
MTEQTWASIRATLAEIEANPLRSIATDPDDSEAYEIVRRIERRLQGIPTRQPGEHMA